LRENGLLDDQMDRYWFFTWTTYGTWLPGDERGFVSPIEGDAGRWVRHNIPGTPHDADIPALKRWAAGNLKSPPVRLVKEQADALLAQFQETAAHRTWLLLAVAVMATHVHLVTGVEGDPEPFDILRDFKSYGSRELNRRWGRPPSDTWWTESGSKQKLQDEAHVLAAIRYVMQQEFPLVIWVAEDYFAELTKGETKGERGA
jgi:REP element-mobilizing transposase RayT